MTVKSLYRNLEYSWFEGLEVNGKVLDLGGCKRSGYHELIKGEHAFEVAGIDEKYGYDIKVDLEKPFPILDESYDCVMCINTLEHVYNFQNVIKESFRILKKDGVLILATPFMYRIHGCPSDYFRFTHNALNKLMVDNGFENVKVESLGSGFFSFIAQSFYQLKFLVFIDKILLKNKKYKVFAESIPLGYITTGVKT